MPINIATTPAIIDSNACSVSVTVDDCRVNERPLKVQKQPFYLEIPGRLESAMSGQLSSPTSDFYWDW